MNDNTPKDNSQRLREVLDELLLRNPTIIGALVVSDDGLNVASGVPQPDDDNVALTASDLMDTARNFGRRLEQGRLRRVLLEGEQRITVVQSAGKRTVLVVSVPAGEKMGVVTLAIRRAASQITDIFG